jgi:GH18 family chitinase
MGSRASQSFLLSLAIAASFLAAPAQAEEIMYLTSWQGNAGQINWGVIDHVMYAFAIPTSGGGASIPAGLSTACSSAHGAGKRCLLSYGGWNNGDDSAFEAIAANATTRQTFANHCRDIINQYGLDGVDMDWEYPEQEDSANYGALMQTIKNTIPAGKLLTAAAANHGYNARAVQDAVKAGRLDFAMIMSYDGGDGAVHSPYSYAQQAVSDWQGYGVPMNRVFLGVPFYGRPSWAGYNTLRAAGCSSTSDTCTYNGQLVYYNGVPTIQQKRNLITGAGGRGLMAWEVSFDYNNELQNAMNGGGGGATPTPVPRARVTPTPTSGGGGGAGCWAAWNASTIYSGGAQVSRVCGSATENFEAAFWTQGNDPCTNRNTGGNGEEWFPRGTCGGGATPTARPRATATARARATATSRPGATATTPPRATATARPRATPTTPSGNAWTPGTFYAVNAQVTYGGATYRCQQAHTAQVGWEPPNVPALWQRL